MDGRIMMKWGYLREPYYEYGTKLPLMLPMDSHKHALITGSSGAGKSTTLLFLFWNFLSSIIHSQGYRKGCIHITFCDFKGSPEFWFLRPYSYYYAGEAVYNGIQAYYERFLTARQKGYSTVKHLLICDEYGALVNYFQAKDKAEKTHLATDIISANAELLMLGRSLSFSVWSVVQYATSDLFKGSRLNYMVNLSLGRQNKEQLGMLFSGEDIPRNRNYQPGEGLLLADGFPLLEVKYPKIVDEERWNQRILDVLMENIS